MELYDLFGVKNIPKFKEKELLSAEADFYRQVKEKRGVYFYKGHRSPTSKKEKGVDVHLAVDIVKNAFLKKCQLSLGLSHEGGKATVLNYLGKFKPLKEKELPQKLNILEIKMALDASTQGK